MNSGGTVYAITYVLNRVALLELYPAGPGDRADEIIKEFLERRGFSRYAEALYVGDDLVDAVTAVLAAQELAREYEWFNTRTVTSVKLLRIDEAADLAEVLLDSEVRRMLNW
jgi:virulence-associated protein VapD